MGERGGCYREQHIKYGATGWMSWAQIFRPAFLNLLIFVLKEPQQK